MKKLLLLGGARYAIPVIEAAHKLGIYIITCDYLPDNYAHKFSDEYANVSIIDKDAVLKKAKELNIDGIMSFACDPGVVTAAYVAEKMGLPSCGSYKSVSILQNKGLFRKFLTENGFNVPIARSYSSISQALSEKNLFKGSVIVKPVDSAGSKGVTRVDSLENLETSIKHALNFSHSNEFIIEDFIEKKGCSSDSDSFSDNGEFKYISFSNQYFDQNAENEYTPSAYCWPSTLSTISQKELADELQRLIKLLDMGTSIYNIETREGKDGKTYIMEVSPRGGGNRLAEIIRYATGVDLITNSVKASIGLPVDNIEQRDYKGFWSEIIIHGDKTGIFKGIDISDNIKKYLYEEDLWIKQGDQVENFSGANKAIGTLVFNFDSQELQHEVMHSLNNYIKTIVD